LGLSSANDAGAVSADTARGFVVQIEGGLRLGATDHYLDSRNLHRLQYSDGIFSEKGVVGGFQKLLEILVPFYIVALAAVATFARDGLDAPMKGRPATLNIRHAQGNWVEHILTRRQFICYMFGYLAFLSLVLFVGILFLNLVSQKSGVVASETFGKYLQFVKVAVIYIFMVPIWQMIVTTLLGVYFMSERLMVMTETDQ
jgi:hypothetical protein